MVGNVIKFAIPLATAAVLLLPWDHCHARPVLPIISKARPTRTHPDATGGGSSSLSSIRAGATTAHRPSSSDGDAPPPPPPSQLESIVANAMSILDLTNPILTSRYLAAMASGLAVSLAMVPEAVSFSCEFTGRQKLLPIFTVGWSFNISPPLVSDFIAHFVSRCRSLSAGGSLDDGCSGILGRSFWRQVS